MFSLDRKSTTLVVCNHFLSVRLRMVPTAITQNRPNNPTFIDCIISFEIYQNTPHHQIARNRPNTISQLCPHPCTTTTHKINHSSINNHSNQNFQSWTSRRTKPHGLVLDPDPERGTRPPILVQPPPLEDPVWGHGNRSLPPP